jgi:hypothetical protein
MFESTREKMQPPPKPSVLSGAKTAGDQQLADWQKQVQSLTPTNPWSSGSTKAFTGRYESAVRLTTGELPDLSSMTKGIQSLHKGGKFVATGGLEAYGQEQAMEVGMEVAKDKLQNLSLSNPFDAISKMYSGAKTSVNVSHKGATMSQSGVDELRQDVRTMVNANVKQVTATAATGVVVGQGLKSMARSAPTPATKLALGGAAALWGLGGALAASYKLSDLGKSVTQLEGESPLVARTLGKQVDQYNNTKSFKPTTTKL